MGNNMKLKLFEYAILLHPEESKDPKEKDTGKTTVIKQPTVILAKDDKQAGMLIAREIPDEYVDKLDQIEVIVRPF